MASSPRPAPAVIVITLMAAAVIGFLVGALVATTSEPDATPSATSTSTTTGSPAPSPTATDTPGPTASVDATVSLEADRDTAATGELIRLTGVLVPAQGDVELQVQQSVDDIGFVDFPVTATTRADGSFAVRVRTGRVGSNEFRMVTDVDDTQVMSNSVVVQIS